jgi:hypothetical protein
VLLILLSMISLRSLLRHPSSDACRPRIREALLVMLIINIHLKFIVVKARVFIIISRIGATTRVELGSDGVDDALDLCNKNQ